MFIVDVEDVVGIRNKLKLKEDFAKGCMYIRTSYTTYVFFFIKISLTTEPFHYSLEDTLNLITLVLLRLFGALLQHVLVHDQET